MAVFQAGAAPASGTCIVVELEGKMEVSRKGATSWSAATTNLVLQDGDKVRTGMRSRAALRWSEMSTLRLGELTTLEVRPPSAGGSKPQMDLKSGVSYFFSREKPSEIQFHTPVASGAIRGTEFNLRVAEDGQTELALLDGAVDLSNDQGNATLASHEIATVKPGAAPAKAPLIQAMNVIQWALYYPIIIDPRDLSSSQGTAQNAFTAYREGNLRDAIAASAGSNDNSLMSATLLLGAGKVSDAEEVLAKIDRQNPPARALRTMIAAVRHEALPDDAPPTTASEWMARSYWHQSHGNLEQARAAALAATAASPDFGAAWVRLAELDFSFGKTDQARAALEKGLSLSPRNAEAYALKGYVLSAKNDTRAAAAAFEHAIELDGALADAWLGRGLCKIRAGRHRSGLEDLQIAATLEPQRAILRSYLGKAWQDTYDPVHARKELNLAKQLDPNDPTEWLYLALLNELDNRVNEAVDDLERSKELNENRSLFRSRSMLEQDAAMRSANLAAIYRDDGLFERSVQEASRAVEHDYGNYSAHLFLAESYDALRDPKLINLRYETPWFSELLVANLLAPAHGGNLSQNISQQEYSRFFASDGLGIFSQTEYFSRGDWIQSASQYGMFGQSSYSLDAFYRTENGFRPNNDLEQLNFAARFKQDITDKDSLFFQASYFDSTSGDLAQYYDQASASQTLRVKETQDPNILLGYHREWSPGNHTLMLAARFDDRLRIRDTNPGEIFLTTSISPFSGVTNIFVQNPAFFSLRYQSELEAYSVELQQIWENAWLTTIVGGRYQVGWADTRDILDRVPPLGETNRLLVDNNTDLMRGSLYAYQHVQLLDSLRLIAGITYDHLEYPVNIDTSPISDREARKDRLSPKAGIVWSPLTNTQFRAVYTRSMGGLFFDNSIRLEPVNVAGFNQAYRSLIPESVVGLVPGTKFETFGLGFDQKFNTRTYIDVQAEWLKSDGARSVGILTNSDPFIPIPDSASSTRQSLDYEERAVTVSLNQLVLDDWAFGARYRMTDADLNGRFNQLPDGTLGAAALQNDNHATLHQVDLYGIFQHRCGFFAQADALWSAQSNRGYSPDIPGDDFWQYNVYCGYRFLQRRIEARVGILNLSDRDYKLNPLTLYSELPRERTFTASLKLNF